jgi:hypothetical protein
MRQNTAGYYRTQAERARWEAIFVPSESVRRQLLAIATQYDDLAKTVEASASREPAHVPEILRVGLNQGDTGLGQLIVCELT